MTVHLLRYAPELWLGRALEEFEAQFHYPLGPDANFSISHGRDYITFFSAIGDATVVVAEHEGQVLATLAAVLRPLQFPTGQVKTVAYFGDLKVAPSARGGRVLGRVLLAMREHLSVPSGCGYGIVMDGTGATPPKYTGRLQVPPFVPLAKLVILRIATGILDDPRIVSLPELEEIQRRLARPGFVPKGGDCAIRSEQAPINLAGRNDNACGLVEDTRRGKRLLLGPGQEMRSAHLSRLAWKNFEDGAQLIRQAVTCCARAGVPGLFVCLPASSADQMLTLLAGLAMQPATATVFGCGFPDKGDWWVDSAEI